jgi:hypothetical protein
VVGERGVLALNKAAVLLVAVATTALAFGLWAPAADARTTACIGVLGPVAVDQVTVPGRASCLLDATQVSGNVVVEPGGALRATVKGVIGGDIIGKKNASVSISRISVGGEVQCAGCRRVSIFESGVGGDVLLGGTVETVSVNSSFLFGDLDIIGGTASVEVTRGGTIAGDFLFAGNRGPLTVFRVGVGGDAAIVDNVSPLGFTLGENLFDGGLVFSRNTGPSTLNLNSIAETLSCFANDPAPVGSGNLAGQVEGQCVGL